MFTRRRPVLADVTHLMPPPSRGATRWLALPLALLAMFPAVWLTWLVAHNWVNVPNADEWEMTVGGALVRWHEGTLAWDNLLAQHNESRKLFPRLLLIVLNPVGPWDVRRQMALNLVFAAAISAMLLALLGRRASGLSWWARLAWLVPINFLLFSPAQWENSLWGIQMICLMPPLALAAALLVNTSSRLQLPARVGLNAALAFFATFSYANGMIVWPLAFPWPALDPPRSATTDDDEDDYDDDHQGGSWSRGVGWRALYVAAAAASLGLYFHDYHKHPAAPPASFVFEHPLVDAQYFGTWCAGPFLGGGQPGRVTLGWALVGAFVGLAALAWRRVRRPENAHAAAGGTRAFYPWLTLGAYALGSGLTTMVGRAGFGVEQASSSRYVTFSLFLPVAILGLAATLDTRISAAAALLAAPTSSRQPTVRGWARVVAVLVLTGGALLYWRMVGPSVTMFKAMKQQRRWAVDALALRDLVPDNPNLVYAYPILKYVPTKWPPYVRTHLLSLPSIPPDLDAGSFAVPAPPPPNLNPGQLDVCELVPDGRGGVALRVSGWARDAAFVVLASDSPATGRPGRPFVVLRPDQPRPDVAQASGDQRAGTLRSGFAAVVGRDNVPGGLTRVFAWSVTRTGGRPTPLGGLFEVDLPPLPPQS